MKSLAYFLSLLLGSIIVISCNDRELILSSQTLQSSKIGNVSRGEPVTFVFKKDSSSREVAWRVAPAEKVEITSGGDTARITFNNAGSYTISATDSVTTQQITITVDTTTYVPNGAPGDTVIIITPPAADTTGHPDTDTSIVHPEPPVNLDSVARETYFKADDEIMIIPEILDSIPYPSISLMATTVKTYKCFDSRITYSNTSSNGVIRLQYHGVYEIFSCSGGNYHASTYPQIIHITSKTTAIEITLNEVTYRGTVTSDGKSFTIDWPYERKVIFSKKYVKN